MADERKLNEQPSINKDYYYLQTRRLDTPKLVKLTCFTSLWDIVNIVKTHR